MVTARRVLRTRPLSTVIVVQCKIPISGGYSDMFDTIPLDVLTVILDFLSGPLAIDWQWRLVCNGLQHQDPRGHQFFMTWHLNPYIYAEQVARQDLVACALVSKAWAQMLRPYIFRKVAFRFFLRPLPGQRSLEDIEARVHSSEYPITLVKSLRLIMFPHESYPEETCDVRVLQAILGQFTHLQVVELIEVRAGQPNGTLEGYIPPNLDRLYCSNRFHSSLCSADELSCLLACFGDVGLLQLEHDTKNLSLLDDIREPDVHLDKLRVRTLDAMFADLPLTLAKALCLSPTINSHSLKTLSITAKNLPGPKTLWEAAAPCLEEFRLDLHSTVLNGEPREENLVCDLSQFVRLRKFTLLVPSLSCTRPPYTVWTYIRMLLSRLVPPINTPGNHPSIQSITVRVEEWYNIRWSDNIPRMIRESQSTLAAIDRDLHSMPSLTLVRLGQRGWSASLHQWSETDHRALLDAFPMLKDSGQLRIVPPSLVVEDPAADY